MKLLKKILAVPAIVIGAAAFKKYVEHKQKNKEKEEAKEKPEEKKD